MFCSIEKKPLHGIKRCPVCKEKAQIRVSSILGLFEQFQVDCPNYECLEVRTRWFDKRSQAVNKWNTTRIEAIETRKSISEDYTAV